MTTIPDPHIVPDRLCSDGLSGIGSRLSDAKGSVRLEDPETSFAAGRGFSPRLVGFISTRPLDWALPAREILAQRGAWGRRLPA